MEGSERTLVYTHTQITEQASSCLCVCTCVFQQLIHFICILHGHFASVFFGRGISIHHEVYSGIQMTRLGL